MKSPLIVPASAAKAESPTPVQRDQPITLELEHDRAQGQKWVFDAPLSEPKVTVVERRRPPLGPDGMELTGSAKQVNHYTWDAATVATQPQAFSISARLRTHRGDERPRVFRFVRTDEG